MKTLLAWLGAFYGLLAALLLALLAFAASFGGSVVRYNRADAPPARPAASAVAADSAR